MNATTKLRLATLLRRLADRLNPPAQTITVSYSNPTVYGNITSSPGWSFGPLGWSFGPLGRDTP